MTGGRRHDVVLLDALGTLVALDDPGPRLAAGLAARGVDVPVGLARAAMGVEMAHYRAHCDAARDTRSLEALRDDCAAIVARELGGAASALARAEVRAAMLDALRFTLYDEVDGVLRALRAAGARLVVVSNWDVSLHEVAATLGLDGLVDAVLTSAEEGTAKPDPGLLLRALRRMGDVPPVRAVMVGDTDLDVEAGLAAGTDVVLVDRHGIAASVPAGVTVLDDLRALPRLVAGDASGR